MERQGLRYVLVWATALAATMGGGGSARAGMIVAGGSPAYDAVAGTGFNNGAIYGSAGQGVNNVGLAVGVGEKFVAGVDKGGRGLRWDSAGTGIELANLGTNGDGINGISSVRAYAINDAGTIAGSSDKYVGGVYKGTRPVRWDANGVLTELGNLGTDGDGVNGSTTGYAVSVNAGGMAAGYAYKYVAGVSKGTRAVRWDAGGTAATELGNLGTTGDGVTGTTGSTASAINVDGVVVGACLKYVSGVFKGNRPVRWDAGSTVATELGNLGTSGDGLTGSANGGVNGLNNAGTAVGYVDKYVAGASQGTRAVRWDAGGTKATELDNLGTMASGYTYTYGAAVNSGGTVVGYANKYVSGVSKGTRAVRWDAGGTKVTELANLGTDGDGVHGSTTANAYCVNDAGTTVGMCYRYVGGVFVDQRATVWLSDASAIDLNSLGVVNASGGGTWVLNSVQAISPDGWAYGLGTFDPDGSGPLASYGRLWVGQVGLGGSWLNTTGASNTWGKGANWSTGTPAIQLDATFNAPGTYTVGFDKNASARKVEVASGTVTMALGSYSLTAEQGVTIDPAAKLSANGTIVGDVINHGTFAPGNSPGTSLIQGNYTDTGTLEIEIASADLMDTLSVSGDIVLSGAIKVILYGGYVPTAPGLYHVLDWQGRFTDTASFDFSQAVLGDGLVWDTALFDTNGTIAIDAVPEPASLALLALGAAGLLARKRR